MKNTCKIHTVFSLTNSLIFIHSSVYFIHTAARFYTHFLRFYILFLFLFLVLFLFSFMQYLYLLLLCDTHHILLVFILFYLFCDVVHSITKVF